MEKTNLPTISIVTPFWNEAENIPSLTCRLGTTMAGTNWEWVAVDDGSTDQTAPLGLAAVKTAPSSQFLRLARNFGQQAAYRAGLDVARGDAVIFLDADMQDPPEKIPELIAAWQAGAKLVIGCRRSRKESGIRGWCMNAFHLIFYRLTGGLMPRNSGTFGLMDRKIVEALKAMPESSLFLPALRCWVGYKREFIWYDRDNRVGEAKQTYAKLFAYAWDGITSFSELPLRAISFCGLLVFLAGLLYSAALIGIKILQLFGMFATLVVPGFTTLAVLTLGLNGLVLVAIGIIGEYISKIFREVKRRPAYILESNQTSQKP